MCVPMIDHWPEGECPGHCMPPCEWATEMVCSDGYDGNGNSNLRIVFNLIPIISYIIYRLP